MLIRHWRTEGLPLLMCWISLCTRSEWRGRVVWTSTGRYLPHSSSHTHTHSTHPHAHPHPHHTHTGQCQGFRPLLAGGDKWDHTRVPATNREWIHVCKPTMNSVPAILRIIKLWDQNSLIYMYISEHCVDSFCIVSCIVALRLYIIPLFRIHPTKLQCQRNREGVSLLTFGLQTLTTRALANKRSHWTQYWRTPTWTMYYLWVLSLSYSISLTISQLLLYYM